MGKSMNKLLEAALDYASRGWYVLPCKADKTPFTRHGVNDASIDTKTIEKWWQDHSKANVAIDVGRSGMMVLDLDPGSDKQELEIALDGLPNTQLKARTPRGGEHLFYGINADEIVAPSASKIAAHVDVRSFHSYVLLAPSTTLDGQYEWISEGQATYRTDTMVRLANSAKEKSKDRDNWIIDQDLGGNIILAIDWLKTKAKVAIEGQGGDHMAYSTAAMMKSFGISETLAMELIWEHWNPRCNPPWDADEWAHLEAKVFNSYSYNTSPPGNMTPGYKQAKAKQLFKPVTIATPDGVEIKAGHFRFVDRDGMEHIRPPEWLIEDFLPQDGYAMMFGAFGTFKTFIALDIALSITTGFPDKATWTAILASGSVLFAAGEGRPGIKARINAWEQVHWFGNKAQGIVLADPVPNITENLEPFIEGAKTLSPDGYKLVVIDTVGRAMAGTNENAQENASTFTNLVDTLRYELNCAVLALHHTGHSDKDRARGSSVFGADADVLLGLERRGKAYIVDMEMHKQKDAAIWKDKLALKLSEINITGTDQKSLVAAKYTIKEPDKAKSDQSQLQIIDDAIQAILANNKERSWSGAGLAEAVGTYKTVDGITAKTVATDWLPKIKANQSTKSRKCFDAERSQRDGQWRWTS
ncbi:hypothetical protein LCGC14_0610450 [marine sediment metagenome]|uniref:DNA primase/polymerase bifunctional N-terminal domain-containing protein n=1 Tax=marine sediment metagenome TaxID=412755 RepID=A0A0F9TU48_9ZZZZ